MTNISVRQIQRRGRERKPTCSFVVIAVSGYSDKMLAINLLLRMNIIAITCTFYPKTADHYSWRTEALGRRLCFPVFSVLCSNEECSASAQEMFTLATVSVPLHKLRIQASVCSSLQAPEGLAASPGQKGLRFHKNDQ